VDGPPTRRIDLLRHAKSSWDDAGLADHDRPLTPRGRRAAMRIGRHLRDAGVEPELILCSSARRTQDTLARLELTGPVSVERELYGASSDALLERLRETPDEVRSLLLLGHNPGIQDLAMLLAGEGPLRAELGAGFPTAALATLTFEGGWPALRGGACELVAFVRPRELD
jgi:phosphohistidine phosphatase